MAKAITETEGTAGDWFGGVGGGWRGAKSVCLKLKDLLILYLFDLFAYLLACLFVCLFVQSVYVCVFLGG